MAASIRVLDLPGLPPKGDVVDWAAAGGTVERLHELIEHEAKPWTPEAKPWTPTAEGDADERFEPIEKKGRRRREAIRRFIPPHCS